MLRTQPCNHHNHQHTFRIISPHCCPRLFLADPMRPEEPRAWQELTDTNMAWAPVHVPQTGRWDLEWVCLRCNTVLRLDHPLLQNIPEQPSCTQRGPRILQVDIQRSTRAWTCSHPHAVCSAEPLHTLAASANPTPPGASGPHNQPWARRGHLQLVRRATVARGHQPPRAASVRSMATNRHSRQSMAKIGRAFSASFS